jgi:quercetin dioxygenase-like cupin family protein
MLKQTAVVFTTALAMLFVTLCSPNAAAQQGQNIKLLLEATSTVAGMPLKYPGGAPKVTANLSTLEPNGFTPRHKHPVPTFIYVVQGTLAIDVDGAPTREVKAGDAFMEVEDTWHRNRNPSATERVQYLLVFMGDDKTPYVIRAE